jgi:hypothetical protein
MITFVPCDIYGHSELTMMTNKLFCTFVEEPNIDEFISDIKNYYTIAYNKIFVLYVKIECDSTTNFVTSISIFQISLNNVTNRPSSTHEYRND